MGLFKEYIFEVISFSLFLVLIEMLIPSKKFKKYFDLCIGFIMVLIIVAPVVKFISRDFKIEEFNLNDIYFLESKSLQMDKKILTKRQNEAILKVYKNNLQNRVKDELEDIDIHSIDIKINEDMDIEKFGEIQEIFIYLNSKENNDKKISKIEKIKIEKIKNKNDLYEVEDEVGLYIKNKLLKIFNIEPEKIHIK